MAAPDKKLIILRFTLFVLMGLGVGVSLLSHDPRQQVTDFSRPSSQAQTTVTLSQAQNRHPAQVTKAPQIHTLKLECADQPQPVQFSHQTRQVRFNGQLCKKAGTLNKTTIVNRTNGTQATVFQTGKNHFSSDLVDLVEGTNQILITHTLQGPKTNKEVIQLEIERAPSSTQSK